MKLFSTHNNKEGGTFLKGPALFTGNAEKRRKPQFGLAASCGRVADDAGEKLYAVVTVDGKDKGAIQPGWSPAPGAGERTWR